MNSTVSEIDNFNTLKPAWFDNFHIIQVAVSFQNNFMLNCTVCTLAQHCLYFGSVLYALCKHEITSTLVLFSFFF